MSGLELYMEPYILSIDIYFYCKICISVFI